MTAVEFIKIIETGWSPSVPSLLGYIYTSANNMESEKQTNIALEAAGQEPFYQSIKIPAPAIAYQRQDAAPENAKQISESINWNRGKIWASNKTFPPLVKGIELSYCDFLGSFSFNGIISKKHISFNCCNFPSIDDSKTSDSTISFFESSFTNVTFTDIASGKFKTSSPLAHLNISSLTTDTLTIKDSKIIKLTIDATKSDIKDIQIIDSTVDEIEIKGNNVQNCLIKNLKGSKSLSIKAQFNKIEIVCDSLEIEDSLIDKLIFELSNQLKKGNLVVRTLPINQLKLNGINTGSALFKDLKVNQIEISEFTNLDDLRLHKIKGINKFTLQDASLGKADFMDVDTIQASDIKIAYSGISDVLLNNTVIPSAIIASSNTDYSGIREAYRQLKYASSKQGNRIRELEYEALEMDAYKRDTSAAKSWGDKIILWSNEFSNNHGQSWIRSAVLLIILTLSLFVLVKYLQGYTHFNLIPDPNQLAEYFNFALNPLHDFDKVFKVVSNDNGYKIGISKCIDSIDKVGSGYLLFQFLRAFRKYVK